MRIALEGLEEFQDYIERFPNEANKALKRAIKRTAQQAVVKIRPSVPTYARKATSYRTLRSGNGLFGISGQLFDLGRVITPAGIAYFFNYGTLQGRDPNHNFKAPVREQMRGRKGIKYTHWWENCLNTHSSAIQKDFESNIIDEFSKIKSANGK